MANLRTGIGFDAHRFAQGRPLILGGTVVLHSKGLAGHSDADVLTHAIIDALLGAAALRDIGFHFPSTDPQYKDVSSLLLLRKCLDLLKKQGWQPSNVDATIVAQEPHLATHIESMCKTLSEALGIPLGQVSIKATTSDGMGFTGRGEGIAAMAIALIEISP